MDLRVLGGAPADTFLSAADLFETEFDLEYPVIVHVRDDPDSRTWAAHYQDHHVLNISRQVATSAMGREFALHELSHMARNEEGHASHYQSTEEAVFLALAGRTVERRKLAHCYQIANHCKDIYADDLTLSVAPADKLVQFLESELASALANRPRPSGRPGSQLVTTGSDPEITVVNAGFALALAERHDLIDPDHRLYDLAHAAADDAPSVSLETFKEHFRTLAADPSKSEYRRTLVDVVKNYVVGPNVAAD
ncbi:MULTISPECIES: DUF5781 family protein [Haloferax]|uniref:Uncharacterized protein n=1 Tax=Haloferax marinum TaxID=2666143 RepID=A0A6A8G7C2_9EURY|nr:MULTISPECIES: DUF5781 family protein [Haloferax]KAB1197389.1 hypothetical protein Hfx1150_07620 [Haloferax sp. CBA1150]MRW96432.1 hypothetical protein [Haloferax marinum]